MLISRTLIALSMMVGFASAKPANDSSKPVKPATHTIVIEDMKFTPAEITVHAGDQIIWINKDLVPHTVTAEDGKFDSKLIDAGKSWRFKPSLKGVAAYKCLFHPTMKAAFTVK